MSASRAPEGPRVNRLPGFGVRIKQGTAPSDPVTTDEVGRHPGGPMTEGPRELEAKFNARVLGAAMSGRRLGTRAVRKSAR